MFVNSCSVNIVFVYLNNYFHVWYISMYEININFSDSV